MTCPNCQFEAHQKATFCSMCGKVLAQSKGIDFYVPLKKISLFFGLMLVFVCISHFMGIETYFGLLVSDLVFALLIFTFVVMDWRNILPLLSVQKLDFKLLIFILFTSPLLAYLVFLFARFYNGLTGVDMSNDYYSTYSLAPAPFFFAILSVAIMPAITEELAFRGILFHELKKIFSGKETILITATLFFLLHLNYVAGLWLFPIGLFTGYLRYKTNSLWYGIVMHFLYNSMVVFIDYLGTI